MKLLNLKTKSQNIDKERFTHRKLDASIKNLKIIDILKHSNYEILKSADEIISLVNYIKQNSKRNNELIEVETNINPTITNIKHENLENEQKNQLSQLENKSENIKSLNCYNLKENNEITNLNECDLNFPDPNHLLITQNTQLKEEEIYKNIFAPTQKISRDFGK
jgi:hypothetical protein